MEKQKKAIIILGGGLKKDKGKWRTTNFDEGDNFGAQGDSLRVAAGYYLCKSDQDLLLIVSGGQGQYENIPDAPTIAGVIESELLNFGALKENIIKEETAYNTWQQLQETKKIIQREKCNKANIISNKYHLPRIKAMINKDRELKKMFSSGLINLQSAEEVCLKYDKKRWQKAIKDVYNSEAMQERIKLEEKGVRDIKAGKYILK